MLQNLRLGGVFSPDARAVEPASAGDTDVASWPGDGWRTDGRNSLTGQLSSSPHHNAKFSVRRNK